MAEGKLEKRCRDLVERRAVVMCKAKADQISLLKPRLSDSVTCDRTMSVEDERGKLVYKLTKVENYLIYNVEINQKSFKR